MNEHSKLPISEREILNEVPAFIHIRNQQTGQIIWWNEEWVRACHFDEQEFMKDSTACLKRVIHPDDLNLVQFSNEFYQQKTGGYFGGTIRVKFPGTDDWSWLVGISKVIRRNQEGVPLETLAVFVDFTQVLHTELQIKDALHEVLRIRNREMVSKITKREKAIIHLLIKGFSSREIGKHLSISEFTVNTHRRNIMLKLGVKNISELISTAKDIGI